MSIEGMWCFVSGDVYTDAIATGGVVILDTLRIYGGDSAMAYVGSYQVNGDSIEGTVESFRYNPSLQGVDVFGEQMGPARHSAFFATLNEQGLLVGKLTRNGVELPLILQKLRELP